MFQRIAKPFRISIHALLAESDRRGAVICYLDNIISIHALLAESDRLWIMLYSCPGNFYPRSPCGERLYIITGAGNNTINFYPRSPCGERRQSPCCGWFEVIFLSTLSLRRATKISCAWSASKLGDFYPRSPCGERPVNIQRPAAKNDFYPRSPCGERLLDNIFRYFLNNFYPRSPCGERHFRVRIDFLPSIFLSTLSLRRATPARTRNDKHNIFLSTLSLRRATWSVNNPPSSYTISIHALLAESDIISTALSIQLIRFLSTLSLRRATRFLLS